MNIPTYYVTFAEYHNRIGHACDPTDFDGACDAYAECRSDGQDACVMRYDPPIGNKSGMMIDVTEDANRRISMRYRQRYQDAPEWLVAS